MVSNEVITLRPSGPDYLGIIPQCVYTPPKASVTGLLNLQGNHGDPSTELSDRSCSSSKTTKEDDGETKNKVRSDCYLLLLAIDKITVELKEAKLALQKELAIDPRFPLSKDHKLLVGLIHKLHKKKRKKENELNQLLPEPTAKHKMIRAYQNRKSRIMTGKEPVERLDNCLTGKEVKSVHLEARTKQAFLQMLPDIIKEPITHKAFRESMLSDGVNEEQLYKLRRSQLYLAELKKNTLFCKEHKVSKAESRARSRAKSKTVPANDTVEPKSKRKNKLSGDMKKRLYEHMAQGFPRVQTTSLFGISDTCYDKHRCVFDYVSGDTQAKSEKTLAKKKIEEIMALCDGGKSKQEIMTACSISPTTYDKYKFIWKEAKQLKGV